MSDPQCSWQHVLENQSRFEDCASRCSSRPEQEYMAVPPDETAINWQITQMQSAASLHPYVTRSQNDALLYKSYPQGHAVRWSVSPPELTIFEQAPPLRYDDSPDLLPHMHALRVMPRYAPLMNRRSDEKTHTIGSFQSRMAILPQGWN